MTTRTESGSAEPTPESSFLSVLIIDDDDAHLALMRRSLRGQQLLVFVANHPNEALELMQRVKPDVVLIDVHMPDVPGTELLPLLRDLKTKARLVLYSNEPSEALRAHAQAVGADGYIEKGQPPAQLVRQLHSILNAM
ncbi:MAG: response regulator [Myxococcota bacterium]